MIEFVEAPRQVQEQSTLPPEGEHLWYWFRQLSRTRAPAMAGVAAVTFLEMEAWAKMTGAQPSFWEISVLERMDIAFCAVHAGTSMAGKDEPFQIDATDGREVVGFMRAMAARKAGSG